MNKEREYPLHCHYARWLRNQPEKKGKQAADDDNFTSHDRFYELHQKWYHGNARDHVFHEHQTMYDHDPYFRDLMVAHL
jgi:hypothetical protein